MKRYTVRVVKKGSKDVVNIYNTDDHSSAIAIERTAKEIYENAWICDNLIERLVG